MFYGIKKTGMIASFIIDGMSVEILPYRVEKK